MAALESVSDSEVHGHAWRTLGIRLRTIYSLEERRRSTRPIERRYVEARPLMRGFVVSQTRKAHAETLEKMKDLIALGEARLGRVAHVQHARIGVAQQCAEPAEG